MLFHAYNIVIDSGVGAPVHVKDVVDGLNTTDKKFLTVFMENVKLPDSASNNSQMVMHTSISNT